MKAWFLAASFGLALLASPGGVHAQNCWWTPEGYRCHPGWFWERGRPRSDFERREEHEWRARRWREHHDPDWRWEGR